MFMTNQQSPELTEPGIGSFYDPAAFVTPHFASIFIAPSLVVLPVRRNQLSRPLLQSLAQRIRVVAGVGDYALGLLPRTAFGSRDPDLGEPGFVGGVAQGAGEVFAGGAVHAVESGRVAVAHVFKHGAAVMDEMGEIVEVGFADLEFHG